MLLNVPQVQIIDDNDHQTVVKITGMYTAACTANTVVIKSNTLYGANTSLPCLLAVNSWEYSTSLANGFIALEWVSTFNANTTIMTSGRCNDGGVSRFIPNNANTPTGDINLVTANAQPGDSFTLTVSFLKMLSGYQLVSGNANNYLGAIVANTFGYGSGAWANTQVGY